MSALSAVLGLLILGAARGSEKPSLLRKAPDLKEYATVMTAAIDHLGKVTIEQDASTGDSHSVSAAASNAVAADDRAVGHTQQTSVVKMHGGVGSETTDMRFTYEPFVVRLPMFVSEAQKAMWLNGDGAKFMEDDSKCKGFVKQGSRVESRDVAICDVNHEDGKFRDTLLIRKGIAAPLGGCDALRRGKFEESPEAGPAAGSDLLGYDSWSFQHFLDGPALLIAQNKAMYEKYGAKLLTEIRQGVGSYDNPLVPKMLEKAGVLPLVVAHCGSWNTQQPCVDHQKLDLGIGCSSPPYVPELTSKFRDMMGVAHSLPSNGQSVVLILRTGKAGVNNNGRGFTNPEEVTEAVQGIARELNYTFRLYEQPMKNSIEDLTEYFGSTRFLVGAHGGALYNSVFMPPGTGVLEIAGVDDNKGSSYFYKYASRNRQDYAPFYAEKSGNEGWWTSDMKVDTEELKKLMRAMLLVEPEAVSATSKG